MFNDPEAVAAGLRSNTEAADLLSAETDRHAQAVTDYLNACQKIKELKDLLMCSGVDFNACKLLDVVDNMVGQTFTEATARHRGALESAEIAVV